MNLTKHAHATVTLEGVLVDPGAFTPNAPQLLAEASAVVITHEHVDHFAQDEVRAALAARPGLRLWGPAAVTAALGSGGEVSPHQLNTVTGGELFDIDGLPVRAFGGAHAPIHDGIEVPHNIGYLFGGSIFHPGDSYAVPDVEVETLLVPTSGPWSKAGEAIDFITAVAPRRTVQIHDVMLSAVGRTSFSRFLGEKGLTGTPMLSPAPGETVEA
ncbi:MBL fold metallo-hydrolase [Kineosporia succinea]|uniref:L-ascorbate metabolism protein UlaG (Beta-lactamase superfamily) n=1 Tax=Kineosporia succinea TaxID=84632 RepID=A0ABT9PAH6_9ACTN|nr:MBL fold metallo-hydrolase [Kineosporia succinea]MDP9829502.1 L-ascorbate metabolism protein UlaG (beta-lactamase superfamily) [Kineosporia succinea]